MWGNKKIEKQLAQIERTEQEILNRLQPRKEMILVFTPNKREVSLGTSSK